MNVSNYFYTRNWFKKQNWEMVKPILIILHGKIIMLVISLIFPELDCCLTSFLPNPSSHLIRSFKKLWMCLNIFLVKCFCFCWSRKFDFKQFIYEVGHLFFNFQKRQLVFNKHEMILFTLNIFSKLIILNTICQMMMFNPRNVNSFYL